jgi:hypothetical protein
MLHSSILAVFWGPSPTLPGQVREVLNDEISREDEMIPQLNQIPVWITNRCEQSYMSGTNFRLAFNIASHSRASAHNLISFSLEKSVTNINNNRFLPSVMLPVNARSLPNKINELEILVEMQEIDIVCVTET